MHPKVERLEQVKVAAEAQRLRDVQAREEKTERLKGQRLALEAKTALKDPKKTIKSKG